MIARSNGWLEEYIEECRDGRVVAGKEMLMELERLEKDLHGDEWVYDTAEADARMSFMEGCIRLTKSPYYGKPMVLMLWQKAFISALYGFRTRDGGTKRFQRALLLCGRKNSKSELSSALVITDFIMGGEGRDIVCSSNDDLQANILYEACDTMRMMIDPDSLDTHRNQQGMKCLVNGNRIFKLSDRTRNKEGRNIDLAVIDEIHEMKEPDVIKAIEQSQSLKVDPLTILITTEGFVVDGVLDNELRRARGIITGEITDRASDRFLPWLYTQDSEAEVWEGTRENRLWEKSNPSLGIIKRYDYLEQQVDLARGSLADRTYVLSKDFNLHMSSSELMFSVEDYSYPVPGIEDEEYEGCVCLGGVDLAETTDLTSAKVLVMKPSGEMLLLGMYFIPEGKLQKTDDSSSGAKYLEWAKKGYLRICEGNYLDVTVVADWFLEMYRLHRLRPYKIGYDVRFSGEFVERMEGYGFETEMVRQNAESMSQAIRMFEADLKEHRIRGLNDMDRWCLGNVCLKLDSRGNGLLVKPAGQHGRRIDGAVASVISWEILRRYRSEYSRAVEVNNGGGGQTLV